MATILRFFGRKDEEAPRPPEPVGSALAQLVDGFSIEVMPRTAEKVESFRELLPAGTRVYIAHIEGTPIEDMVATARRLAREGFPVMPHFPARIITDEMVLGDWIARYQGEAGVDQALVLAGGVDAPQGRFENSMQLLETGLFEAAGFRRLHVAGHPEGNKDIDPGGSDRNALAALHWKQAFAEQTGVEMAIVTQFCFEAEPVIAWAERLKAEGVTLPIHIGAAGPAKLQTLIRFAMTCGVGASIRVLQRRAADVTRLLLPFTPEEFLTGLARYKADHPEFGVTRVHFYPLGGIKQSAEFARAFGSARSAARNATA